MQVQGGKQAPAALRKNVFTPNLTKNPNLTKHLNIYYFTLCVITLAAPSNKFSS